MDLALQRFLDRVRPRSRTVHLSAYEDVAVALECFLTRRRRSAERLGAAELRTFLGYWYLRHHRPATALHVRRFCAATRVLVRWLSAGRPGKRGRALLREARCVARQTARAARATELLDDLRRGRPCRHPEKLVDDYWEVVLHGSSHLVLRSMSSGVILGPVELPEGLVTALDPGVILNLQLGRSDGDWHVVDHGYCYPSAAAAALREAVTVDA
ncbi:MAG: hypothetical protein ACE5G2_13745 [Candidatus Krumholzibacteriia bacterium]